MDARRPRDGEAPRLLRLLLVEDSEDDALLLVRELRRNGYEAQWHRVETAEGLEAALDRQEWDFVACDYVMPRFSGPAALEILRQRAPDLPVIIVSGEIGEEAAVSAMKGGAHDYVSKDRLARLVPAVERELREAAGHRARRQAEVARAEEAELSAALARVGQELILSLDQPVLLDHLSRVTTEVLDCDAAAMILRDDVDGAFLPVAGYGFDSESWETLHLLRLPAEAMSRLPELGETSQAQFLGLASALVMPLRRGTELIGFHAAGHRDPERHFSAIHHRIAAGIAQLGSVALEHARVRRELEDANRLKSDFVATMSHELRTPLNILIGYGDILREGGFGDVSELQLDILERMDRSARQLLDLINATLDLSRLDAGRPPLDIAPVALDALMRELEQEFAMRERKPGVELQWHLPEALPTLRTDRGKLEVVLKNLIRNALKFTDEGTVAVHVRAWAAGIEFRVEDTGIGIPAEAQELIFDPFRQVDQATTRQHGGVGLGLYVVRRLLDLLEGSIALRSEVGRGSSFTVWLPQDPETA